MEHHQHQHVAVVVGSGETIDQAIFNAIAGLTDPKGHHAGLTFDSFEVVHIRGGIAHKAGEHGVPSRVKVTIQAAGIHQK